MNVGPFASRIGNRFASTSVVILGPERSEGSPESIITACGYGFRARAFGAPRKDSSRAIASAFALRLRPPAAQSLLQQLHQRGH
ncbi:MAG: hypothetical protein ABWY47_09955, partial [Xanthobacteraceae bacterium]